jgi:serine phosphatase RsbU (regulator of sigma subunit)
MASRNDGLFVTFSMATLDAKCHRFEAAGAGHLAPLVRRARGGPIERLGQDETGLPLAIDARSRYRSVAITIEPGDVVVLCTDGVYEAMDSSARCLGLPELERIILAAPPGAPAVGEAIRKAVRGHIGDRPQTDDLTIFCLGRKA